MASAAVLWRRSAVVRSCRSCLPYFLSTYLFTSDRHERSWAITPIAADRMSAELSARDRPVQAAVLGVWVG